MLFFLAFYLSENPDKMYQGFRTILFSTFTMIRNVSWTANQLIRMISEGSCDTKDWINEAENSALPSEE